MRTGSDNINLLGEITSWNKNTRTEAYPGECGVVRGSADGLFPPGLTDTMDKISIFSTDLCRPLTFTRAGTRTVHGVPVQKFDLAATSFANSSVCAENSCYNNNIPTGVQVRNTMQGFFMQTKSIRIITITIGGKLIRPLQ